MKFEIKHRFSGALLFSLECESLKLCLEAAVKEKANLCGANLRGADLLGADLVAHIGQLNGWFAWTYLDTKLKEPRVQVGCRNFTIAEGREYWADKQDRREVLAALDFAEAIAKIRRWGAP